MAAQRYIEGQQMIDGLRVPCGDSVGYEYFEAGDLATAQALTPPAGARVAFIQAQVNTLRMFHGGQTPTSSLGFVVTANSALWWTSDLSLVRIIRQETDSECLVLYFK